MITTPPAESRCWVVIPAAGRGARVGGEVAKQYLPLAGATVLEHSLRPFIGHPRIDGIVVVIASGDDRWSRLACSRIDTVLTATGGEKRMHSVLSGLHALVPSAKPGDWVLVHDAARPCLAREDVDELIRQMQSDEVGGLLAVRVTDTIRRADEHGRVGAGTVDRSGLWRAQTPQMFRFGPLRAALVTAIARGEEITDEAAAMESAGARPRLVPGPARNIKVTHSEDLALAEAILRDTDSRGNAVTTRVGMGFDVHAFGPGDHVMLGGVRVPFARGVLSHSDGDVILHALCDALLGAAGLGDIGLHFPDNDPRWRGASSRSFLDHVVGLLAARGLRVSNADVTLLAEAPKLAAYRTAIVQSLAEGLRVPTEAVNVKATTLERMGFIGRGEGIGAQAIAVVGPAG